MYSNSMKNPAYGVIDREFELSQRNEYSRSIPDESYLSNPSFTVTPYYNGAYNEQTNVQNSQHQHYHQMSQYENEELTLENNILRNIMAHKNSGQIDGAWALITYGEFNRPVTDIYVTQKYYVVDNSNYVQDEYKIGLRSLPQCQGEILFNENFHLCLSQDGNGSIFLVNNSNFPVFIKDYLNTEQPYFSQEVIELQGVIFNQDDPIKIFDIEEFRCEMALRIYHNQYDPEQLMPLCKTNIVVTDTQRCMESSSWIRVTNLQALDLAFDNQEYSALEEQIASFVAAGAQQKIKRKKTLKERTKSIQKETDTKRKTRMSLAVKGLKVKEFMKYSWEQEDAVSPEDAININKIGEFFEPERDYMLDIETENRKYNDAKLIGEKMWAKVKYTLDNMNNEDI